MNFFYFAIIFAIFIGTNWSLDFKQEDQNTGLTFVKLAKARISYDSYTILYHLDISQYLNLTVLIGQFVDFGKFECKRLNSQVCSDMLDQLSTQLIHMKRDEIDIQAYQQKTSHRQKRAIEFIGSIYHWAYGLMDADTARAYDDKIQRLANDSSRFHSILQDQTLLIKESLRVNNQTFNHFHRTLNKIMHMVNVYARESWHRVDWLGAEVGFIEGVTVMKNVISEHRRFSQQILRCLEEVVSGKIIQLIPGERLIGDLIEVEKLLRENQKLPIDFTSENPLHIFKYAKTLSSLYGNRILMEVTIPIVERASFTAYEIIPIPTVINNSTIIIKPSTHYVLLNDAAKEYIPISTREYMQSKFNLRGERIIKPAENVYLDYSNNCEISIFLHPQKQTLMNICEIKTIPTSNYFVSINSNDLFLLRIVKPIVLLEYCRNEPTQSHEITTSGLLTLNKDCRIVTDKISLRPRTNYRFDSNEVITLAKHTREITIESIFARIQDFHNISIPNIDENILIQDYTSDFNRLVEQADKLIERNRMETQWFNLQSNNTETSNRLYYYLIFVGVAIVIAIIAIVWYFYTKFFAIGTWVKLANVLSGKGKTNDIPKLFVRNIVAENRERASQHASVVNLEDVSGDTVL